MKRILNYLIFDYYYLYIFLNNLRYTFEIINEFVTINMPYNHTFYEKQTMY